MASQIGILLLKVLAWLLCVQARSVPLPRSEKQNMTVLQHKFLGTTGHFNKDNFLDMLLALFLPEF
jgi:hypothetical protein